MLAQFFDPDRVFLGESRFPRAIDVENRKYLTAGQQRHDDFRPGCRVASDVTFEGVHIVRSDRLCILGCEAADTPVEWIEHYDPGVKVVAARMSSRSCSIISSLSRPIATPAVFGRPDRNASIRFSSIA